MHWRRKTTILILAAVAVAQSGCQFFPHWMHPQQMWKMNRQPAMDVSVAPPDVAESEPLLARNLPGSRTASTEFVAADDSSLWEGARSHPTR